MFVDAYNHRIHALDANGKTLFAWGGKWRGALGIGPFKVPAGLAIDQDGGMHVADSANKRAVLLDPRGNFLAAWKLVVYTQPNMYSPSRVATAAGQAYFVDTSNDRIVVLKISP